MKAGKILTAEFSSAKCIFLYQYSPGMVMNLYLGLYKSLALMKYWNVTTEKSSVEKR